MRFTYSPKKLLLTRRGFLDDFRFCFRFGLLLFLPLDCRLGFALPMTGSGKVGPWPTEVKCDITSTMNFKDDTINDCDMILVP